MNAQQTATKETMMDANREQRFETVRTLGAEADRQYMYGYHRPSMLAAQNLGLRALLLMCKPTSRKRFNKRTRAIRQQLRALSKDLLPY